MESGKSSSLRSKRRRSSSKGDGDVATKKLHTEGSLVEDRIDTSLDIDKAGCVDDVKRGSGLVAVDSTELTTSTPNSIPPQRRRRRGRSSALLDDSIVRPDATEIPGQSAAVGPEAVDSNSSTRESEPSAERNSRRNKCTSARVLLGLVKRKPGSPGKDSREEKPEAAAAERTDDVKEEISDGTEKPRKSKQRKKSSGVADAESKVGGVTVAKVKEENDVLVSALEGAHEVSLSIEKCSDVKAGWIEPFKQGWRREVVFRNTSKNTSSSKPSCDVYYFSSDDTKLRSLPQIIEYLKTAKSNLTRDCFTFMKNTIYKEPEEQVRSAAFSRGRAGQRTSLQNSNESSMRSFDDVNDDVCSQTSSVSAAQKRTPAKRSGKKAKLDAEVPIKVDDLKLDLPSDSAAPAEPAARASDVVAAEEPSAQEQTETETKEGISAEAGCGQADEVDKRKAVKAAATLALRTYMNHALRAVNNPLLQSKTAKTSEKAKPSVAKTSPKDKSLRLKQKIRPTDRSLLPVVALPKVDVVEEKVRDVSSDDVPKVKKVIEPVRSSKTSPLTKLARIKSVPKWVVGPESEKARVRKTTLLRKLPPSKLSASRATVSKESVAKRESSDVSPNKSSKSMQNCGAAPAKPAKPRVITTPTVGKIHPKSDVRSMEKPAITGEKRPPAGPVLTKPVESALIPVSRVCGMDCPLRLGIMPSLLCTTCMCAYHPECTGYVSQAPSSTTATDFTCWFCRKLNKELEDTSYAPGKCEFPSSSETYPSASKPRRCFESSEASCSKLPLDVLASTTSHKSSGVAPDDISAPSKSQDLAGVVQDEPANAGEVLPSLPTAQLLVLPIGIKKFLNLSMALILVVEDQELQVEPDQLKTSPVGVNIRLPMGTLPDVFVRGPESPLEFRVLSAATSGRQVISVALYKWPCDAVSEKISAYIDKEVSAAGPCADPAVTRPSDADPSAVDPKSDVGPASCATLIQPEADVTIDASNLSSHVTEPTGKLSMGSDGDYQTVPECHSGLSETPACSSTKISESETAVVTVFGDESSAEDQKRDVAALESGFGLEALDEASHGAVDRDDSNILASQSSDKVNLSDSHTDDAGSIEVGPTRVSEDCSREDEKADLLGKYISSDAVSFAGAHQGELE